MLGSLSLRRETACRRNQFRILLHGAPGHHWPFQNSGGPVKCALATLIHVYCLQQQPTSPWPGPLPKRQIDPGPDPDWTAKCQMRVGNGTWNNLELGTWNMFFSTRQTLLRFRSSDQDQGRRNFANLFQRIHCPGPGPALADWLITFSNVAGFKA